MKDLFIFLIGGVAGSLITWKLVDKKYRDIANEEIESVKKTFKERQIKDTNKENSYGTYKDIIKNMDYNDTDDNKIITKVSNDSNSIQINNTNISTAKPVEKIAEEEKDKPYTISPEEFGEIDYETKSWTLYSDGILVDEFDQIVEDEHLYLGDCLKEFNDDDAIYVRNDKEEVDYEILKVTEEFSKLY